MARIKINAERKLGEIHPHLYGQFIEHLGRCIYGGIYDPGSDFADERGYHRDVMEAIRELNAGILRWPGGNFASGYHWLNGVGADRKARPELAWETTDPNTFGTNEFIEYAKLVNCEPYICLNMGNGTMEEAIAWVEYCNLDGETEYARMRREHGYERAHNVTYWGLGNEIWGDFQIGHKTAEDYAWQARDWAKVLKRLDPDIKLVACGGTGNMPSANWDLQVLQRTAQFVDYTALHYYWGPRDEDPYLTTIAGAYELERYIYYLEGCIDAVRRDQHIDHPIRISVDEWNVNYHSGDHGMRYTLRDALADAVFIHMLQRHCNTVKMANLAQTVNVIPAIESGPEGMFTQSIYWPLWLGANVAGPSLVDCWTDVDTYRLDLVPDREMPYLDTVATLDSENGRLVLSAVNVHPEQEIEAEISVSGAAIGEYATIHTLAADSTEAHNDFDAPDNVSLSSEQVAADSPFRYTFGAHSQTVIEFELG